MAGADADGVSRTGKAVKWRSGRVAVVVPQQTAEALATLNRAFTATDFVPRLKDLVGESLMITFRVAGLQRLPNRRAKRGLPEENRALQTLEFQRAEEPLQVDVPIWALGRQRDGLDAFAFQEALEQVLCRFRPRILPLTAKRRR